MITIDGVEYRTLEEQVKWLTENHTSGTYSGTDWQTLTIDGVTKNLPTGGSDKAITDIIVSAPGSGGVSIESGVGIVVETSATVQYDDGTEDEVSFSYYIPITAGTNVTFTVTDDDHVVISASGGGGGTTTHDLTFGPNGLDIRFDGSEDVTFDIGSGLEFDSEAGENEVVIKYSGTCMTATYDSSTQTLAIVTE